MIEFDVYTDLGSRALNEDSFGTAFHRDSYCFVVADGLGGHGGGEIASRLAVDAICRCFVEEGWHSDFFSHAFAQAQKDILGEQERKHAFSRMKTTAVVLVLHENQAEWAHIGDSRLYFFKKRKLKYQTEDHSVPQMLVLSGDIKPSQIRRHPDRNRLLRVLGNSDEDPKFEVSGSVKLSGDSYFLLCTDGFWEREEERDMLNSLKNSNSLQEWMDFQKSIIRKNGLGTETDNSTCIAVRSHLPGMFGR